MGGAESIGSRGQLLKEEFLKGQLENGNKNSQPGGFTPRPPGCTSLDKIVSGYEAINDNQLNEDAIFNKCRTAIGFVDKMDKDIDGDYRFGQVNGSITCELKGQGVVLRDSIQQLRMVESSRASLVTLLRDALQEQEYKLNQPQDQLQAAQAHSEQADRICSHLLGASGNEQQLHLEQNGNSIPVSQAPRTYTAHEQSSAKIYTRQVSTTDPEKSSPTDEGGPSKMSSAAEMAAKLTASTSSAQMLTYVLSSLASEGAILSPIKESSSEYLSEKRIKIDHSYVPPENLVPHLEESNSNEPPPPLPTSTPPPLLPPLLPPYHEVPQFTQATMVPPYGCNSMPQPQLAPVPAGYAPVGLPINVVGGVPASSAYAPPSSNVVYQTEGGDFYSQRTAPMDPH